MFEKYRLIGCEVVSTDRKDWWVHIRITNKRIGKKNVPLVVLDEALQVFKTFVAMSCNGHPSEFYAAYYDRFQLNNYTARYLMIVRRVNWDARISSAFFEKYNRKCKSIRISFEAY